MPVAARPAGFGQHQFRVVDRHQRRDVLVDDGHFHLTGSSVMMQKRVISEAVPAVVLMAMSGNCGLAERSTLVIPDAAPLAATRNDALGAVVG